MMPISESLNGQSGSSADVRIANAKHHSKSQEHYTPRDIIFRSKHVMGEIDLDVCSSPLANCIVGADQFYDRTQDGLTQPWYGRVFCNPPGGTTGGHSNLAVWWRKLRNDYDKGQIDQAVFLGFQLSVLRICPDALDFTFVIPSRRLHFWVHEHDPALGKRFLAGASGDPVQGEMNRRQFISKRIARGLAIATDDGWLVQSDRPSHDNVIIYLPPRTPLAWAEHRVRFWQQFQAVGRVAGGLFPPLPPSGEVEL